MRSHSNASFCFVVHKIMLYHVIFIALRKRNLKRKLFGICSLFVLCLVLSFVFFLCGIQPRGSLDTLGINSIKAEEGDTTTSPAMLGLGMCMCTKISTCLQWTILPVYSSTHFYDLKKRK